MNTQIVNEIRREDGNAHFNAIIVRARAARKKKQNLGMLCWLTECWESIARMTLNYKLKIVGKN